MILNRLFFIQGIATLLTFFILVLAPPFIPASFGIKLASGDYFLPYTVAAGEISLFYLSFKARKIRDVETLRMLCSYFIIFHSTIGVLGIYSLAQGTSIKLLGNVILRVITVVLFSYYGLRKNPRSQITAI